ncbi:MAG: endonuclease domain-containing protein [Dehalococcoidia bacterium]
MERGRTAVPLNIARVLRKAPTISERLLWERLRNRQLEGLKVRRQHPIYGAVLDFYCPDHRLAIEVDGSVHESSEARLADAGRDERLLREHGIRTLRFSASEVENHIEAVLCHIAGYVNSTRNTSPLHENGEGPGVR